MSSEFNNSLFSKTQDGQVGNNASLINRIRIDDKSRPTPSLLSAVLGVIRYESARSMTFFRGLIWVALTIFPVALVAAVLQIASIQSPQHNYESTVVLGVLVFLLLSQCVTVLSMLLFAAPIVNAELESQTWIYAVVRPRARKAILLGKYAVAVVWCGSSTSVATVMILGVGTYFGLPDIWNLLGIELAICWLAAVCYGALFVAIGTFFQRRAIVYAFVYALAVEAFLGWTPAVVNLFTISYRLRSLLFSWIDSQSIDNFDRIPFQWEDSPIKHLSILTALTLGLLAFSMYRIERNQYRWQTEL
jgi:ABC-type transport system involved in multi-copper enzyme maturation permease subunit